MKSKKINRKNRDNPSADIIKSKQLPVYIQSKLAINNPDDPYEREADAVANQVMRMQNPALQANTGRNLFFSPAPLTNKLLQQKCAHCDEEEKMQRKEMNGQNATADNELENYVGNLNGGGQPLPADLRNGYELKFGYDFSNVKVHTDADASRSAQSIHALAYTSGTNIVFNRGQYDPASSTGKKLLAHELTHVVQQGGSEAIPAIQKNTADDHNLQSENFSGDEVLEGCFDGEVPHYLKNGKRGEPVRKLQAALVQLGFELPQFGVDGIFKQETDRAVRNFQREHELSADGIVGPITIGTMDALLPGTKPAPPEPKPFPPKPPEPQPECPVNTPAGTEPVVQAKLQPTNKPVIKQRVQQQEVQRKHLTMRESMDEFSKKVNSSVSSDPLVTSKGQFYWSQLAGELINKDLSRAFSMLDPITGKSVQLMNAIVDNDSAKVAKLMKEIPLDIEKSGAPNAPDLVKIFIPTQAEDPTALWAKFNKLGHVPSDFEKKHKNFSAFMQLRNSEKSACFSVADFIRGRFQKQGGYTDIDSSKKGKTKPTVAGTPFTGATRNFEWVGDKTKGDVVNYDKSSLSSLIAKIKSTLDDGFTLHARVVSGVNFGLGLNPTIKAAKGVSPTPKPVSVTGGEEHSLVIIGYDDTGDEFIFWDPDSSQSNFNGRQGFNTLHFTSGRFTTAANDTDLLVNENGMHGSTGNKRYQVLRVFS